jgi:hypothetical protein
MTQASSRMRPWLFLPLVLILAASAGCQGEVIDPRPRVGSRMPGLSAPPRVGFELVADSLQVSCGTLDCHGQTGRNLRLFGARGLRLDLMATPAEGRTTAAEYEASYWSLVGLEPELLSEVVVAGGADADRLSMVRKMRGSERHKGGQLATAGDDLDRCLSGWLAGNVDTEACRSAARTTRPGAPPADP